MSSLRVRVPVQERDEAWLTFIALGKECLREGRSKACSI